MHELVYCSTPARLGKRRDEIIAFVASQEKGPLHPFAALPYEYFEGGALGRDKTLETCCRLVDICDEFWVFGISEGVLIELEYFFERGYETSKALVVYAEEFDPEWELYFREFKPRFGSVLKRLGLRPTGA